MQCGLPLQHRRVSAWNRYHSGARPLLPSAAHRPPLWQVWWGLWALLFPAPFLTSGQHCMCYLLWVTLTPGFYLLPVALGQAGDRTFHMVTQTEGAPPIPPPPTHTHTLLQRSHNFQLWVPVGFAVGFLCSREKCWAPPAPDPQGLVIMAPAPSFHLGRNLRPLSSQLLPEAVASLLELTLPFDFLLLLLMNWGVSPKKTCGVLIPVPQEEGLIWK